MRVIPVYEAQNAILQKLLWNSPKQWRISLQPQPKIWKTSLLKTLQNQYLQKRKKGWKDERYTGEVLANLQEECKKFYNKIVFKKNSECSRCH